MSVDFFGGKYKSSTSKDLFGLCDDNSTPEKHKEPAYLSEDLLAKETEWIAEVSNQAKYNVDFHPIDNNISLERPEGKEDGKCDCMLHYEKNIVFAELKERKDKSANKWKKNARDQLKSTILHFKKNHSADEYTSIKAHICNNLKPAAVEPSPQMQQQFKDDTGCILYIGKNINL